MTISVCVIECDSGSEKDLQILTPGLKYAEVLS